jgi:hypothetical protein
MSKQTLSSLAQQLPPTPTSHRASGGWSIAASAVREQLRASISDLRAVQGSAGPVASFAQHLAKVQTAYLTHFESDWLTGLAAFARGEKLVQLITNVTATANSSGAQNRNWFVGSVTAGIVLAEDDMGVCSIGIRRWYPNTVKVVTKIHRHELTPAALKQAVDQAFAERAKSHNADYKMGNGEWGKTFEHAVKGYADDLAAAAPTSKYPTAWQFVGKRPVFKPATSF